MKLLLPEVGQRVAIPNGMVGFVVMIDEPRSRSCSFCPRRISHRNEPDRYNLCSGCTEDGDEGAGSWDDGFIHVQFSDESTFHAFPEQLQVIA